MFTLALFRSIRDGKPFNFTPGGLISFGMFEVRSATETGTFTFRFYSIDTIPECHILQCL